MRLSTFLAVAAAAVCLASVASAQEADQETHKDLVKLGQSLLPSDDVARPDARAPKGDAAAARPSLALDAAAGVGAAVDLDIDAADAAAADAQAAGAEGADAAESAAAEPGSTPADTVDPGAPSGAAPAGAIASAKPAVAPVGIGPSARRARVASGKNSEQKSLEESPIARLGVPEQAVPAVATTAAVGTMAIWPFLVKTLSGLLKSIVAGLIKNRAKKGQKIDKAQRRIRALGFDLRPAELGALLIGALIYGLAVCYSFQGRKLSPSFLMGQEALIVLLYYSRSFVRFGFERRFKLPTQFKFWIGGAGLCLFSAYLGTTLGTVGYELEEAATKDDGDRIVRMKAMLTGLALGMALVFFAANVFYPTKIFQSGRAIMSGMALAEILPITPMPGKRIFAWNKTVWALLAATVVPSFLLINYFL